MGVHGLWRLLESTGKPINPETLEGKILAVDISIWLNQAVKGVRDRDGNSVQNAHLLTLFHRICKLLFFRIRPVFVFDGDAPLLKKQTLALRRQRKEELTRESKQTNEKLLKTFLKRQAIKAALGDRSQDPLPSLSSVTRNEVDDMYVLPALPPAEEKDESRSDAWERLLSVFQGELYEDPNSVDINSEEFASLPPEMKHEILKDMKEFSKRRRTMYQKPPELSGEFSQYQLAGLLHRNHLNQRLESVQKEMSQRSAGGAPQLYQQDGDQQDRSVESHRLVSEDHSHYILIKSEAVTEPAAAPWSGSSLSGCKRRAVDRPQPLWRPVCEEEEEEVLGPSSEDSKPSASKPAPGDASPPSPRTLEAIQAAMNDSSDEEKVDQDEKHGRVSPRTLLAIQQVLAEEEDGAAGRRTPINGSSTKLQVNIHRPAPQVVISSSEEETGPDDAKSLPNDKKSDFKENSPGQSVHVEDSLLVSSSEDEMEEVIVDVIKRAVQCVSSESFIEVSEEEFKEEDADDSLIIRREKGAPAEVQGDGTEESLYEAPAADLKSEEEEEEEEDDATEGQNQEKELKEATETESGSTPAVNEWEHLDMEELEALESSLQVEQSNLREQKQQQERMANTVTGQMYLESQELLRLFGVPFLVAPTEAESQCAALDRTDQTHGTITDDSDVWLFGGRHVYKNFFSQNKYVEHYQYSDLQNQLGLDRTKLINLAYLLGSDYTEGVPGVGYVTGMEILNEFPGPGKWWSEAQEKKRLMGDPRDTKVKKKLRDLKLQPGFPNPVVAQAYLEPAVDQSDSSFCWGRPQLDMIKEYPFSLCYRISVCVRFGWSSRKTEETLQPVIKQLNAQQTQLRIDSFFRMEQQEKQAIRSQRLRRAVTCLKRKERDGGEEDSEEEKPSPVKPKKGKAANKNAKKGEGGKEEENPVAGGGFLGSEVIGESSSSSGEDSDGGCEVAMVTARSVFEGSRRGHRGKSTRGRGKGRGKK
uniref:Excision repair cross-complementation group 5 n=1 Tax=Seriola lalandi dorsalis TaxID=1841481 RepID=A0A3B4WFN8_SERLL